MNINIMSCFGYLLFIFFIWNEIKNGPKSFSFMNDFIAVIGIRSMLGVLYHITKIFITGFMFPHSFNILLQEQKVTFLFLPVAFLGASLDRMG